MSQCVLARQQCPETNDTTKRHYCPAWVVGVVEDEKDGSGRLVSSRTYTGCMIPKLLVYMVGVQAESAHAHAAANQARDAAIESGNRQVSVLKSVLERGLCEMISPSLLPSPITLSITETTNGKG